MGPADGREDGGMSADVWYTTGWSSGSRRPSPGHEWLDGPTARELYLGDEHGLFVVDASRLDEDGAPLPRWTIALSPTRSARVTFLDDRGSVWRTVDYLLTDGRLFRTSTDDYTYPDDGLAHDEFDALSHIRTVAQPDGTGGMTVTRAHGSRLDSAPLERVAVDGFWLDVPAFGDWDDLSDPEFGIPATEPTGS